MSASIVAVVIVGNPDNNGGMAGPLDPVLLVFSAPGLVAAVAAIGRPRLRSSMIERPWCLVLAATSSPSVWYGAGQALMQRFTWPPLADPHHQAHWYLTAVVAIAIVLVTASAALAGEGWRSAVLVSAGTAIAIGTTSLLVPSAASSLARAWAVLAIGWGVVAVWATSSAPNAKPADHRSGRPDEVVW